MKIFITMALLIISAKALAADKSIGCLTQVNGVQSPIVQSVLTRANPRLEMKTADGIIMSATNDGSSSLISLQIADIKTVTVYTSTGSLGDNGEGLALLVPHNGKQYMIVCVKM